MSGLSPIQVDKQWFNYFISPLSVYTLLSMKYFVLRFAVSSKDGIK